MRGYDEWKLDSGYEDGDEPEPVQKKPVKIVTYYDPPPIPTRNYDWAAMTENYEPYEPVGYGRTEAEAITDLQEQLDD